MFGSILVTCFSYRRANKDNIFTAIAYVIPCCFFSLAIYGDFWAVEQFFMWSAVAFALASGNLLTGESVTYNCFIKVYFQKLSVFCLRSIEGLLLFQALYPYLLV